MVIISSMHEYSNSYSDCVVITYGLPCGDGLSMQMMHRTARQPMTWEWSWVHLTTSQWQETIRNMHVTDKNGVHGTMRQTKRILTNSSVKVLKEQKILKTLSLSVCVVMATQQWEQEKDTMTKPTEVRINTWWTYWKTLSIVNVRLLAMLQANQQANVHKYGLSIKKYRNTMIWDSVCQTMWQSSYLMTTGETYEAFQTR